MHLKSGNHPTILDGPLFPVIDATQLVPLHVGPHSRLVRVAQWGISIFQKGGCWFHCDSLMVILSVVGMPAEVATSGMFSIVTAVFAL